MPSLVTEFIINPVIRQARRLSERAIYREHIQHPEPSCIPTSNSTSIPTSLSAADHATTTEQDEDIFDPPSADPVVRPVNQNIEIGVEPASQPTAPTPATPQPTANMTSPASARRSLPADDGMGELRKRLLAIQSQSSVPSQEKARLMHETLMEGYRRFQTASRPPTTNTPAENPVPAGEAWAKVVPAGALDAPSFWQISSGEASSPDQFTLSADDIKPTYVPLKAVKISAHLTEDEISTETRPLGCQHYRRNVKLQCSTCAKWYTCRFCHDAVEDHELIRKDTKNMLCMLCTYPQKAAESCANCNVAAARYFCNICKLWDDHPNKDIYHCNDCGICRRGQGLGKDFFHCKKCCACISISIKETHKCIERSTDCDCPICGDYMFTSPKPVVFMVCGHSIHARCYDEHMRRSYKCPICNKSLLNMETQFRQLELEIQAQPMPAEFRDTKAVVLCNDCSGKSTVPYHWLGLKCAICNSYNTVELQISGRGSNPTVIGSNDTQATSDAPAQSPVAVTTGGPGGTLAVPILRHRRFSSVAGPEVGAEPRHIADDRLARSSSPPGHLVGQSAVPWPIPDTDMHEDDGVESDEDIVSFWSSRFRESSDDDLDSMSEDGDEEDEDEDEDDNFDIVLIGHR